MMSALATGVDSSHAIRHTVSVKPDKEIFDCMCQMLSTRLTGNEGRFIAQARVQSHVTSSDILGGRCSTGAGFQQYSSVFPCYHCSTAAPYSSVTALRVVR
jgi:hypothetical protein